MKIRIKKRENDIFEKKPNTIEGENKKGKIRDFLIFYLCLRLLRIKWIKKSSIFDEDVQTFFIKKESY